MLWQVAYVVARPRGRFEIRESLHTPKGPRARTLANFEHLTDKVLETARRRATRPFDPDAVRASAFKAGRAADARRRSGQPPSGTVTAPPRPEMRRFVAASRRMASALESRPPVPGSTQDPGDALMDLLDLTAQISPFRVPPRPEPLRFPPLARLRAARTGR